MPDRMKGIAEQYLQKYPILKRIPVWGWALIGLILIAAVTLVGTSATPAPGPPTAGGPFDSALLGMSVILKLGAVILLIYLSAMVFQRWKGFKPKNRERMLSVIETTHLSPRQTLHLVRVGDKTVLIGATDHSVTMLSTIEESFDELLEASAAQQAGYLPVEPESSKSFAALLK